MGSFSLREKAKQQISLSDKLRSGSKISKESSRGCLVEGSRGHKKGETRTPLLYG
tara:strand:+ start:231 stop:395 length:165 start_codon:yes stop_codon:yes gene_type:complete